MKTIFISNYFLSAVILITFLFSTSKVFGFGGAVPSGYSSTFTMGLVDDPSSVAAGIRGEQSGAGVATDLNT